MSTGDILRSGEVWSTLRSDALHDRDATTTRVRTGDGPRAGNRIGERLRQLRVAAGLTQSELAGQRFSKEYLSQIEREDAPDPGDHRTGWPRGWPSIRATWAAACRPTSGGASKRRSPGPTPAAPTRGEEALREYETVSGVVRGPPARSSSSCARCRARPGRGN